MTELKEILLGMLIIIYGIVFYIVGRTNFLEKFIIQKLNDFFGLYADEIEFEKKQHGEWIRHSPDVAAMRAFHKLGIGKGMGENSIFWTCSCCDSWGTLTQNYCPNCGAKMDGGKAE